MDHSQSGQPTVGAERASEILKECEPVIASVLAMPMSCRCEVCLVRAGLNIGWQIGELSAEKRAAELVELRRMAELTDAPDSSSASAAGDGKGGASA